MPMRGAGRGEGAAGRPAHDRMAARGGLCGRVRCGLPHCSAISDAKTPMALKEEFMEIVQVAGDRGNG